VFLLRSSMKIPIYLLKAGNDHVHPNSLKFTIPCLSVFCSAY
jgi:hypothetical protein